MENERVLVSQDEDKLLKQRDFSIIPALRELAQRVCCRSCYYSAAYWKMEKCDTACFHNKSQLNMHVRNHKMQPLYKYGLEEILSKASIHLFLWRKERAFYNNSFYKTPVYFLGEIELGAFYKS